MADHARSLRRRRASDRAVVFACDGQLPALRAVRRGADRRPASRRATSTSASARPARTLAVPGARAARGPASAGSRPAASSRRCGSTRGGPRRPTCGWRCRRPSPATTGGSSISTPTSSCRAATSAALLGRRPRRRTRSAAVRDNIQWRTPRRRPEQFRRLGLPAAPYFNSGRAADRRRGLQRASAVLERCLAFAAARIRDGADPASTRTC